MKILKTCTWLFFIQLFIGTFTFGGGYVVLPMVEKYYVAKKHLFTEEELMEMAAISQSAPGAIAVNLAVLAGYRTAGMLGALVSCTASLLPSLVILSLVTVWYEAFAANQSVAHALKGMQAGVAAVILVYLADMLLRLSKEKSLFLMGMVPAVFAAGFLFRVNIVLILIICCVLCLLRVYRRQRGGKL